MYVKHLTSLQFLTYVGFFAVVLAAIALIYLGWTLTVYFLEPGLR